MNDMIETLSQLSGIGQEMLWTGFVVFLRVGAAMALLPAFGEQAVPQRVRLCLALAFTAVVAPAVSPGLPAMQAGPWPLLLTETLVGLALGVALRLFVHALQIAGAIAAQSTSIAQLFAGAGPEPQPAIGYILIMAGLALAVAAGLHVRIAEYLILSYDVLPAGKFPAAGDMADWGLAQVARAFALGFSLAVPFVIAAFLYNLALGIINRAMPQLMVSFVGAPALTAGALVLLALTAPLALAVWIAALNGFLAAPFSVP
jgi:flagellar biosynthetic protein FliR